nr:MAG TPA: hypothetical protein [Caudoviricetes sp.]
MGYTQRVYLNVVTVIIQKYISKEAPSNIVKNSSFPILLNCISASFVNQNILLLILP